MPAAGPSRSSIWASRPAFCQYSRASAVQSALTSQHSSRAARGQPAGQADRGVPGERADLDHPARGDEPAQQRHERALLGADLQVGPLGEAAGRFRPQLVQDRVRGAGVRHDVLVDLRTDVLGSGSHVPHANRLREASGMQESEAELGELQALLDDSLARATGHLRSIVRPGRSLTAAQLVRVITGMCTLAVSSVTAAGEPRVSGADGHFLHGCWVFSTERSSAKAGHFAARPAISAAHLRGDDLGVFTHGRVEELNPAAGAGGPAVARHPGPPHAALRQLPAELGRRGGLPDPAALDGGLRRGPGGGGGPAWAERPEQRASGPGRRGVPRCRRAGAGNRQPDGGLVPSRYARAHGVAFLHPEPASERVSSRPGLHSLLRADVRGRDHPGDPDHAAPLEGGGRRPGPGRGRGPVGRPGGHRRGPDLLRPDHPEVHPAPLVRGAGGLGRRAGHLGRDRPGRGGRVLAGAPVRGQRDGCS